MNIVLLKPVATYRHMHRHYFMSLSIITDSSYNNSHHQCVTVAPKLSTFQNTYMTTFSTYDIVDTIISISIIIVVIIITDPSKQRSTVLPNRLTNVI